MKTETVFQLGQHIEDLGRQIREIPNAVITNVELINECGVEKLDIEFRKGLEKLTQYQTLLQENEEKVCAAYDAMYARIREKRESIRSKVEALGEINLPYFSSQKVDELVRMAERLSGLSEENWNRVLELAKALGCKEHM